MKKLLLLLVLGVSLTTFYSCDDEVSPKAELKSIYSLNCVIRNDSTVQIATISRSYDVDGYDPMTNSVDPFIKGAKISLTYFAEQKTYLFKDTVIQRAQDSRYKTPLNFYSLKGFKPERDSKVTIEAVLPNGKVLKAESKVYNLSPYLINTISYTLPKGIQGRNLNFSWSALKTAEESVFYYVPELYISYSKIQNGKAIKMIKKVPYLVYNQDGSEYSLYPSIQTNNTNINFDTFYVRKALLEIGADDPNKSNYIIDKAYFRLFVLDRNLAIYYAAQKTFLDEFSVRVTQPEFSNINGGLGIFGTLSSVERAIPIDARYINSFGYRAY